MHRAILRYFITLLAFSIITIITIDSLILPFLTKKSNEIFLPDVRNLSIEEAEEILSNFNLKIHYMKYDENYKEGEIINTSPRPYTKVKIDRDIKISVASAKKDFIMGSFIDNSFRSVKLLLDRNNIIIDTTIYEYSENIERDNIIDQYPKSGKKVLDDTNITLIVSKGIRPDYYRIPDLINLSLNSALKKIAEAGLLIGKKEYEYVDTLLNNTIIYQDQPANKIVSTPREINLIISKDTIENE